MYGKMDSSFITFLIFSEHYRTYDSILYQCSPLYMNNVLQNFKIKSTYTTVTAWVVFGRKNQLSTQILVTQRTGTKSFKTPSLVNQFVNNTRL